MFCPKCGNEVAEGSSFCGKCGNPINPQYTGSTQPIQENQVSDGATAESSSKEAAPAKKKKKSKIIVPIAAVLLVAVIGVAAAFATDGFGLFSTGPGVDSKDSLVEVDPKDTVEEYTWEELSVISAEIATASDEDEAIEIAKTYNLVNEDGTLDGTQIKSVTLTDGTETSVQIAGFVHDDKSDGSGKAGITFIFTDAIATKSMNSECDNTGGWESSEMRSWLASEGKALLPEELQNVIVAVDKSTNNAGYVEETDDASTVVTTTSDELWLFSYVELVGEVDESDFSYSYEYLAAIYNAEGSQYKLFSDCGVDRHDSNDILEKTYQGHSDSWWERSSMPHISVAFWRVNSVGITGDGGTSASSVRYGGDAWYANAVVPGFCI